MITGSWPVGEGGGRGAGKGADEGHQAAGFQDGRRGQEPRNVSGLRKPGKASEWIFSSSLQKAHGLDYNSVRTMWKF